MAAWHPGAQPSMGAHPMQLPLSYDKLVKSNGADYLFRMLRILDLTEFMASANDKSFTTVSNFKQNFCIA